MEARIILKGSVTKDGIGTQEARIENEDTRKEEANSSYVSAQLPKSQACSFMNYCRKIKRACDIKVSMYRKILHSGIKCKENFIADSGRTIPTVQ